MGKALRMKFKLALIALTLVCIVNAKGPPKAGGKFKGLNKRMNKLRIRIKNLESILDGVSPNQIKINTEQLNEHIFRTNSRLDVLEEIVDEASPITSTTEVPKTVYEGSAAGRLSTNQTP